jgi:hypothetical protein
MDGRQRKRGRDDDQDEQAAIVKRYCADVKTYGYLTTEGVVTFTPASHEIHIPGKILTGNSDKVYVAGDKVTWLDEHSDTWRQVSLIDETFECCYNLLADVCKQTIQFK